MSTFWKPTFSVSSRVILLVKINKAKHESPDCFCVCLRQRHWVFTEIKAVAFVLNMSVYWHRSKSKRRLLQTIYCHYNKITFVDQCSGAEKGRDGQNDLRDFPPILLTTKKKTKEGTKWNWICQAETTLVEQFTNESISKQITAGC